MAESNRNKEMGTHAHVYTRITQSMLENVNNPIHCDSKNDFPISCMQQAPLGDALFF